MQALSKDDRFFAQVDPSKVKTSQADWSEGVTYKNVVDTVHSLLGADYKVNAEGKVHVEDTGVEVYDMLSRVLPFPSSQSTFFWQRFCFPYGSMLQTANYTPKAQTTFLIFIFARVIGLMGPDERPSNPTMLTIDGSPCEGSWVIPTGSKPVAGEVNRQIRFCVQPTDPRTGKFLRGSQVLDWLASTAGGLGLVVCKDGWMNWRLEAEKFFLGEDTSPEDECAPGTGFYLGFGLHPSGLIGLKAYYQPTVVGTPTSPPLVKSPIHIGEKDFTPLTRLLAACHPSLVDQFQLMLEYFDSLEYRLKPLFHMVAVDVMSMEKNRLKIYFQTRVGYSWNDVKRNFTLGGRLNSPEVQANVARLEMLWNLLFPDFSSTSGKEVVPLTNIDENHQDHDEHPVSCFGWYYEFAVNSPSVVPKVYFPCRHYCKNDLVVFQAMQKFYDHPTVRVEGPPDGEHGSDWVVREAEKSYSHRALADKPGVTTWVTFGHKHTGYEMMTYFSPEIWQPRDDRHKYIAYKKRNSFASGAATTKHSSSILDSWAVRILAVGALCTIPFFFS